MNGQVNGGTTSELSVRDAQRVAGEVSRCRGKTSADRKLIIIINIIIIITIMLLVFLLLLLFRLRLLRLIITIIGMRCEITVLDYGPELCYAKHKITMPSQCLQISSEPACASATTAEVS